MAQVVLVNCPISFTKRTPSGDETSDQPLGLMYIASYLEESGKSVKIFDPTAQGLSLPDLLGKIESESPLVVGLSALTSSLQSGVQLASAIRERMGREITIGMGGSHANVDLTFIKRFPVFDFQVVGEGEKAMLDIVNNVISGRKVSRVHISEQIRNLDDLPFPARHPINVRDYLPDDPHATMIASRGCPYNCLFCSIPGLGRKVRFRSAGNIVDEMEKIYDDHNGKYSFVDECFTLNRRLILDFCSELEARRLNAKWYAMTRADRVDEELIKRMARAGCVELFFGVESGNERIRKEVIHKHVSNEQIFKAIKWCRKFRIQATIFLMLGFPTETKKEINDTINFGARSKADTIGIHLTAPLPGSEIFVHAVEGGSLDRDVIDKYAKGELGDGFRDVWPIYIPKGSSRRELINAKKRAYRKFYLNPSWVLRRLYRDLRSLTKMKQDLKQVGRVTYALIHGGTKTSMS